jgi:adenylate cyclase class 2
MQGTEVELKFSVADGASFLASVERLGFALVTARTFESNTLYDTRDRSLRARKQILRLRQYGSRATVTHKRLAGAEDPEALYKTRIETESQVEDPAALAEIFVQLGYHPVFRYEKFRTEWKREGGHLVLDETPIGIWAELEGEPAWLESTLHALGVPRSACSRESYGMLFLAWKQRTGSPAEHLTFDDVGASAEVPPTTADPEALN